MNNDVKLFNVSNNGFICNGLAEYCNHIYNFSIDKNQTTLSSTGDNLNISAFEIILNFINQNVSVYMN